MFHSLRNPAYRLYWTGSFISQMGNWVQMTARPWLVYEMTGSTAALGLIAFLGQIPLLFLSLFGGVLADRVDRKRLIGVTQTLFMGLAFLLAALVWSGAVEVWHVAALSLAGGIVTAFDLPARQSIVTDIVGKDDLMNAIALNSASFNTARILGPSVAGLLLDRIGMASCFTINGLTFLAILLSLPFLRIQRQSSEMEGNVWGNMMEGIDYIRSQPRLKTLISIVTVSSIFALPYGTLMPAFAKEVFGTSASGMGALLSATGLGALTGALMLARLRGETGRSDIVTTAAIGLGISLVLFSLSSRLSIALLMVALVGLCATSQNATTNTLIQIMVPDRLRGRVMSAYVVLFQGIQPFGNLQMGYVADHWGAPVAVRVGGFIALTYSVFAMLRLRRMESPADYSETFSPEGPDTPLSDQPYTPLSDQSVTTLSDQSGVTLSDRSETASLDGLEETALNQRPEPPPDR